MIILNKLMPHMVAPWHLGALQYNRVFCWLILLVCFCDSIAQSTDESIVDHWLKYTKSHMRTNELDALDSGIHPCLCPILLQNMRVYIYIMNICIQ